MAFSNDGVLVAPAASGANIATQLVDGKEVQVVMLADPDGHLKLSRPVYRLTIPSSAVGSNKVHADLFNATGSGRVLRLISARVLPDIDTAVTGVVAVEIGLTRTTAVGTGGTAATADGTTLTAPALSRLDTASSALPAGVTARSGPTGGATGGALLGLRQVFTEETNAGAALAAMLGAEFIRDEREAVIIRENEGVRFVQGTVAGVGALVFELTFEAF